jgi:hypothetical protein
MKYMEEVEKIIQKSTVDGIYFDADDNLSKKLKLYIKCNGKCILYSICEKTKYSDVLYEFTSFSDFIAMFPNKSFFINKEFPIFPDAFDCLLEIGDTVLITFNTQRFKKGIVVGFTKKKVIVKIDNNNSRQYFSKKIVKFNF